MKTIHQIIRERIEPPDWGTDTKFSLNDLRTSEWSTEFESLMRNRLIMGALRYGKIGDKNKPKYNRLSAIAKNILIYNETGNDEFLVDIANLCLLEFVEGEHPNKHFKAADDKNHVAQK